MPTPPAVVLVRPTRQGNVGSTARAMANMGLSELVLVEPAVEIGDEARAFAVGAGHVLDGARRETTLAAALAPYERVVGTTSSRHRMLDVPLVTPRELAGLLPAGTATALLFGTESSGLTSEELSHCGILVNIPCSPVQPTLNLAQAVLVVAYELQVAGLTGIAAPPPRAPLASSSEVGGLLEHATAVLQAAGFDRDNTFTGVLADLRQLAARSDLSTREVTILRGVCRRLGHALHHAGGERAAIPE